MLVTKRCTNHLINLPCTEDNPKVTNFHDILNFSVLIKFLNTYQFSIKSSWADSWVEEWKFSNVSGTDFVPIFKLLLMAWWNRYWQLGHLFIIFGFTKPLASPWQWRGDQSLNGCRTFTPWLDTLPEKMLLNSNAADASGLATHQLWSKSNPNYTHTTRGTPHRCQ